MTDLSDLLSFDPLSVAEKVTGTSYNEDEATMRLGFLMAMGHNERKRAALQARRDTHYGITYLDAIRVFERSGFEVVYSETFPSRSGEDEVYAILWNPEGILATAESYRGPEAGSLNSSKVMYNVEFGEYDWSLTSSGHFAVHSDDGPKIWVGDHDGREAIAYRLDNLRRAGTFLSKWIETPFMWLLNYADTDDPGYDYKALTRMRYDLLPEHVREAVGLTRD